KMEGFTLLVHNQRKQSFHANSLICKWLEIFLYSNEGLEPAHIHVQKAEKEAKFWLPEVKAYPKLAFSYGLSSKDIRYIENQIFESYDTIYDAWNTHFNKR
ncbi:DUF4160 domain-containing protein, partial [Arthrospira platensis SPKY1]|nr:DUF4160 domain-containing protein [Arthrospira platensis SPKY1]